MNMKIYLASPLFTEYEKKEVRAMAEHFRHMGYEVYVPMEHSIEGAWDMSNLEWGAKVFEEDIKAIQECDIVACLYYGLYSDSGTAWECGYAYGIGKPVHLYDYANEEVSLMVINGAVNISDFTQKNQT